MLLLQPIITATISMSRLPNLAGNARCQFVLPQTCLKAAGKAGIPRERISVPTPGTPFTVKSLKVEPIHAIHGNQEFTVLTREPDFIESITRNCGYVFNLQGKRILQPGDSVLTEEHLNLKGIDALFISPTVHNMYVDRSMILINRLEPAYIFPSISKLISKRRKTSSGPKGIRMSCCCACQVI